MHRIFKWVVGLLLSFHLLFAFEVDPFPKGGSLVEIFSTNCLQMTQSQQMLKAYLMTGIGSSFGHPKESLAKAIPAYDKRMQEVKEYFQSMLSDPEAKKAFDDAQILWWKNKRMFEQAPGKENALLIKKNFQEMIPLLLKGSKPLATDELELITLTGMLCRKPMEITIDYLMRIWGIDVPNYEEEIRLVMEGFNANLKKLRSNPLNTDESRALLTEIKKEFAFFEFMYNSKRSLIPSLLSRTADKNFMMIRKIKTIYKAQQSK